MELTTFLASTTAMVTDIAPDVLTFFLGIVGAVLVVALGKAGVMMAYRWIVGIFRS
jgi:hypothetical protein